MSNDLPSVIEQDETKADELKSKKHDARDDLGNIDPDFEPAREEVPLTVSATLFRQICTKARKEGIEPSQLASELLAEGLVLRAWEIMERKVAMRGGNFGNSQQQQQQQRPNPGNRHRGGGSDRPQRRNNGGRI